MFVGSNEELQAWAFDASGKRIDSIAFVAGFVLKLSPDGKWGDSWKVDDRENDIITGIAVTKNNCI